MMMLTIEYVPSVLAALESAFPTPPKRAKQQLDKYLALLERLMRLSQLNRSVFARRFDAYDIPLTKLINGSPTINNKQLASARVAWCAWTCTCRKHQQERKQYHQRNSST
jgi:hypothetical protein